MAKLRSRVAQVAWVVTRPGPPGALRGAVLVTHRAAFPQRAAWPQAEAGPLQALRLQAALHPVE
jgi:hypothetical protein